MISSKASRAPWESVRVMQDEWSEQPSQCSSPGRRWGSWVVVMRASLAAWYGFIDLSQLSPSCHGRGNLQDCPPRRSRKSSSRRLLLSSKWAVAGLSSTVGLDNFLWHVGHRLRRTGDDVYVSVDAGKHQQPQHRAPSPTGAERITRNSTCQSKRPHRSSPPPPWRWPFPAPPRPIPSRQGTPPPMSTATPSST